MVPLEHVLFYHAWEQLLDFYNRFLFTKDWFQCKTGNLSRWCHWSTTEKCKNSNNPFGTSHFIWWKWNEMQCMLIFHLVESWSQIKISCSGDTWNDLYILFACHSGKNSINPDKHGLENATNIIFSKLKFHANIKQVASHKHKQLHQAKSTKSNYNVMNKLQHTIINNSIK